VNSSIDEAINGEAHGY